MADPVRQLRLLWRHSAPPAAVKRGPKPALSVDVLVSQAIEIADGEGLQAVSVRRLTAELGIARNSIYTHVAQVDHLVELMVDEVLGQDAVRADPAPSDWRSGVRSLAAHNLDLYRRHGWLRQVPLERPPLGPGVCRKYEQELAVFDGLGLGDVEMDLAVSYVVNFVRAMAGDIAAGERAARTAAETTEQWWQAYAETLAGLMDPADYPLSTRVGAAAGEAQSAAYDAARSYEFGLSRVIDGLAALIEGPADRRLG